MIKLTIYSELTLDQLPYAEDNANDTDFDEETQSDPDQSVYTDLNLESENTIDAIQNPTTSDNIFFYWPEDDPCYSAKVAKMPYGTGRFSSQICRRT